MNVKKYRAATTREALEQIKQDLGEDAFVLETKQVKTGGFLGLRSQSQIEISAALPHFFEESKSGKAITEEKSSAGILNLKDETLAEPEMFKSEKTVAKDKTANALSFRAANSNKSHEFIPNISKTLQNAFPKKPKKDIETVELSSDFPRLVHTNQQVKKQKSNLAERRIDVPTPVNPRVDSKRELEMIRAELREVKFSLGAFASQSSLQKSDYEVDFNEYGEVYDSPFYDSYIELTSTGLSPKIIRESIAQIIPIFRESLIGKDDFTKTALQNALDSLLTFESDPLKNKVPSVLAIIGATGVGKTTTIAKLAARIALQERRQVELITVDTYRIAAVEQLKTYAEIIGAGCHVVQSVLELEAILTKLPEDSTVLIDTTGKNPYDLADQFEISDYLRKRKDIYKCLAVQATMNPIDAKVAIKKFDMYGTDCLALTKIDETIKPGKIIEAVSQSSLPLIYFCNGQRVPEDIDNATAENLTKQIMLKNSYLTAMAA